MRRRLSSHAPLPLLGRGGGPSRGWAVGVRAVFTPKSHIPLVSPGATVAQCATASGSPHVGGGRSLPGNGPGLEGGRCYNSFVTGRARVRPGGTIHGTCDPSRRFQDRPGRHGLWTPTGTAGAHGISSMSTASPVQRRADMALPDDQLLRIYRLIALIRRFEERAEEQYTRDRIGGYLHNNIGEEATVVGAVEAVQPDDYLFASYRDHGIALALTGSARGVMAELFGKETGLAHGRGGSMHLLDVKHHFLGGWGIVGGQIPIAVGAGLALDYQNKPGAVLVMLGDAATNIGAFHEAANIAGVWRLPVVFMITNNGYGMGTSVERGAAEPELYKRAAAYKMRSERVD